MRISNPSYPSDPPLHSLGTRCQRAQAHANPIGCRTRNLHDASSLLSLFASSMNHGRIGLLETTVLQKSILSVRLMQAFSTEYLLLVVDWTTKCRVPGKTAFGAKRYRSHAPSIPRDLQRSGQTGHAFDPVGAAPGLETPGQPLDGARVG